MRIYRGTMQFQLHRDSPCAILAVLDSPQVGSLALVCIWRHRKEIFLWDGEQSSREKSDHMEKPIWSFALTKVMITCPSSAALPFCPPIHPHTRTSHSGTRDNSQQGNSAHWVSFWLGS